MENDKGVYKYLDCSTGHITREDSDFLTTCDRNTHDVSALIVDPHPYGFWIHVPTDDQETFDDLDISTSIKAILVKARAENCFWVNLDSDGYKYDDLETYEWTLPIPIQNQEPCTQK